MTLRVLVISAVTLFLDISNRTEDGQKNVEESKYNDRSSEAVEGIKVPLPNRGSRPWTRMIEALHDHITITGIQGMLWPPGLSLRAVQPHGL
eukprot:CAMPEP_0185786616 /NCGR_PEP_ID=MMETSP1174-20130828/136236_1 /TAXON_ID=35687 /ORGANISM="Dictyocha speculum, Strain CCMP1381" /LENGTH=91 /DNA_ID=CAMNT_0028479347 /DNA_START=214 /DNA_END=489 /DNA_ORIENTATION=+